MKYSTAVKVENTSIMISYNRSICICLINKIHSPIKKFQKSFGVPPKQSYSVCHHFKGKIIMNPDWDTLALLDSTGILLYQAMIGEIQFFYD